MRGVEEVEMADKSVVTLNATRDRITVSFSRKYNVAQYESLDIHVGLGADKLPSESIQDAFKRVESTVEAEFQKLCGKLEGSRKAKGGK